MTLARNLNEDGKANLDDIYDKADPRQYYLTLGQFSYLIPDASKSVFIHLYEAYRRIRGAHRLNVLDVGCSYGVNAALQKFGLSMSELQARYAAKDAQSLTTGELRSEDERFFRGLELQADLVFTGLDVADNAVRYAVETRVLDGGIVADLEVEQLDEAGRLAVEASDLIIATGSIGYVGRSTFEKLAEAGRARPWIAAFVLRQYSFEPIAEMLEQHGYETEHLDGVLFPQRRFINAHEQNAALRRLDSVGRAPTPLEDSGWFASEFFFARPREEAVANPLSKLLPTRRLAVATLDADC